ncbi:MAG TPA: hypothetical protein VMS01_14330, partial [Stellaceae bacterium]|nr:hypothetical protein [Stellaceae bacterium]
MQKSTGWLLIVGWLSLFAAAANAQTPSGFDGTYRVVSATNVNATYTDRNGRMGPCPNRKPGPLHIANGQARYTNATGYKLRGAVGPQGALT